HRQRSFFLPLEVYLRDDQWQDGEVCRHPSARSLNAYVRREVVAAEERLRELKSEGWLDRLDIVALKERFRGGNAAQVPTFKEYLLRFSDTREAPRTREVYRNTLGRIEAFADADRLQFSDMTVSWLREFEAFLRQDTPSVNGRAFHFRNIRAVFNDAINENVIGLELYPFRRFKIKQSATIKRSLTLEQLREIRDRSWCGSDPRMDLQEAADAFLLIFYLIGINVVDLMGLTEVRNGRVEYRRAKTHRLYSIQVEPEAQAILDRYPGEDGLLKWRERYSDYRGFTARTNKRLAVIGQALGVDGLTTYWARHTWATIAASLDIPNETIAAALGHGGNTVTDIYIDFDRRKVDAANRRVIDFLNGK
ncbi:MAG: site-specific integrase, partial [Rikenella sp.]|nr:site-specific integrase [Rikenella sp.]